MLVSIDNNNKEPIWPFNKFNYLIFGIGVLTIILGYILMSTGEVDSFQSIRLSPYLLFIGYVILIPLSIFFKK
ncbi:MAG: hypothetical protein CMG14_01310 [Candidatus Marinimicrobia bacterium]|nr:hypothetical protein [Candidatus Neomarinimicrobiota bacterium]